VLTIRPLIEDVWHPFLAARLTRGISKTGHTDSLQSREDKTLKEAQATPPLQSLQLQEKNVQRIKATNSHKH
jgi:hypothetical protein